MTHYYRMAIPGLSRPRRRTNTLSPVSLPLPGCVRGTAWTLAASRVLAVASMYGHGQVYSKQMAGTVRIGSKQVAEGDTLIERSVRMKGWGEYPRGYIVRDRTPEVRN